MVSTTTLDTEDYRVSQTVEIAYLALVIAGGQVLVPILFVLSWIRGLNRHPILLSFFASWTLFSLATCLLLYTGHGFDKHPPEDLCISQVSLTQAALLLIAFSAVSLVLNLRFTLPTVTFRAKTHIFRDVILVAFPFVGAGGYLAAFFYVHSSTPSWTAVERGRFTCRLVDTQATALFSKFVPIAVGAALIICLAMSIWMLCKTVKHLFRVRDWTLKDDLKSDPQSPWLPILMRFALFCIYATLSIAACVVVAVTPQGLGRSIVDWYTASLPLSVFAIFVPWPKWRAGPAGSPTKTISLPFMSPTATLVGEDWSKTKEGKNVKEDSPEPEEYVNVPITPVRPLERPPSIYRPTPQALPAPMHEYQQSWNPYSSNPVPAMQRPQRHVSNVRGPRPLTMTQHNVYATYAPVSRRDNRI